MSALRDRNPQPEVATRLKRLLTLLLVLTALIFPGSIRTESNPIYLDPQQPIERRVEDLLSRMTLKEKVGQLNLPCVYVDQLGKTIPEKMQACKRFTAGTYTDEIGPGAGFFTLADTILHEGTEQQAEYFNELQKIALTKTRLKIPLLEDEEGTHGGMFSGATVFPEGLAISMEEGSPRLRYLQSGVEASAFVAIDDAINSLADSRQRRRPPPLLDRPFLAASWRRLNSIVRSRPIRMN